MIAHQDQALLRLRPEGRCEHASEFAESVDIPFEKCVENGFGIAIGVELMPGLCQFLAQVRMVIELAVIYDPDVLFLVGNGLVAGLDIDDAESPHGEADVGLDEKAIIIRPAMSNALVHFCQRVPLHAPGPIAIKHSADSAHS